jgi:germination protein ypeB
MTTYEKTEREVKISRRRSYGVLILTILFSAIILFFGLGFWALTKKNENYRIQLDNLYNKNYYELNDNMSNLEVKLSKLMVTNNNSQALRYLNDISSQAEFTAANLGQLPTGQEAISSTNKFVNQLGDYCKSLFNKLSAGGSLSEEDLTQIEKLYDINLILIQKLNELTMQLNQGYSFTQDKDITVPDSMLGDGFGEMGNGTVEYPQMIYDGPFSDSLINAAPKGLPDEEKTQEDGLALLQNLGSLGLNQIAYVNQTEGQMVTFNYSYATKNGVTGYAQISQKGAKLILLDNMRALDNVELSVENCVQIAEDFVKEVGVPDMQAVWQSDYQGYVYVNLAPVINDTIYYPDLIKVIVARDTGEVLGYEAKSYYYNHVERELPGYTSTVMQARQKVFKNLDISSERLALIPLNDGSETLAYEFYGEYRDMQYFIYIDVVDLNEVNVLRVIDSENGSLVL